MKQIVLFVKFPDGKSETLTWWLERDQQKAVIQANRKPHYLI